MKKFLSLLMSVLLVFSAASVFPMAQTAQGREYYIDSANGDDASDGGAGENGSYQEEELLAKIVRIVRQIVCRLKVEIGKLIDD